MPQVEVEEALPSVNRSVKGKSCLSGGRSCPCEVKEFVHDMVLFVKPPPGLKCMYMMPLGEDYFCVSSMRGEIYKRFGSRSEKRTRANRSGAEASPM